VQAESSVSLRRPTTAILAVVFASSPALAHRVDVGAYVADGRVLVEACYSDGEAVREAAVEVTDPDGNVLIEGRTSAEGRYQFTLAAIPAHINVVVKTADGHRGAKTLPRESLLGLLGAAQSEADASPMPSAVEPPTSGAATSERDNLAEIKPTLAQLKAALVRHEVALHDLQQQLALLNKPRGGVSTDRVLAGVGLIVGLTGIAAYCLARRSRQS